MYVIFVKVPVLTNSWELFTLPLWSLLGFHWRKPVDLTRQTISSLKAIKNTLWIETEPGWFISECISNAVFRCCSKFGAVNEFRFRLRGRTASSLKSVFRQSWPQADSSKCSLPFKEKKKACQKIIIYSHVVSWMKCNIKLGPWCCVLFKAWRRNSLVRCW